MRREKENAFNSCQVDEKLVFLLLSPGEHTVCRRWPFVSFLATRAESDSADTSDDR